MRGISKHCFIEGLQELGNEDNEDDAFLRKRATEFYVCLNRKLSK